MTTRKLSGFSTLLLILAALPQLSTAQTTVTLLQPTSPSLLGVPVVLGAAVTPATATGHVTFYDGVTVLGTKPLTSGAASISTILLTAGSHKLKAYYGGDASNAAATSNVITQTVNAQSSAGFAIQSPLSVSATSLLAMADFNGDGNADLVILNGGTLSVLTGDGAGNFQVKFTTTTGLSVAAAAAGDFNGDGIPDLALANASTGVVTILLGSGDGTFQTAGSYPVPNPPRSLAVADFNGDGKADIATADPVNGVNILLGNGDGTFQPAVPYLSNPQASGSGLQANFVLVGDFNADGKADLATINASSASVSILLGKGDGTFQAASVTATPSQASTLAVGYFNSDAFPDLATNNGTVLLGKGDGTFQPPVTYSTGSTPVSVAVGDFNGDGNTDLVFSDGLVSVLLGKGDGTFQQPPVTYTVGAGASSVLVGEFNSDRKTDLALVSGNSVSFLLGTNVTVTATAGTPQSTAIRTQFPVQLQVVVKNGANPVSGVAVTFTAPSGAITDLMPVGSPTATLSNGGTVVTDVNGLASVTATANALAGSYTVTATALGVPATFSLTNLTAAASSITPSPTLPQSAVLGAAFPNALQVTIKDPSGLPASGVTVSFTAPASGASAVLSSPTAVTNISGVASVTATANNTAGSYLVTATAGALSTTFSLTNLQSLTATIALGTSSNPSNFGAPLGLTAMVSNATATGRVTFFDGVAILGSKPVSSGVASLSTIVLPAGVHKLTAYYRDDANSVVGTSNVVTQTVKAAAGGAFVTQTPLNLRPAIPSAAVGDFNGDNKADFAFPAFVNGSAAVTVLLGNGDGTFQPSVNYPVTAGSSPAFVVTGDFNRDGNTDLAVATVTPGAGANINILLGNGDGTFQPAVSYAAGANTIAGLAVGDFNSDGKADLVVTYSASHGVSLLFGNGDGTFGAPVAYSALGFPLAVADFNGDGKPDLALGNTSILNVSSPAVQLGNGDGTAQSPLNFSLGASGYATSLVSGDFNGDGKADLAVGGFVSGAATTWILIGNGDGTFLPAVSYSLGAAALAGDFNGDGFIDLVVTDSNGNTVGILQGKGDGTFQQGPAVSGSTPLAVTDFNGDGRADILTSSGINGTVTVLLGATSVSFAVTATGGTGQSAPVGNPFALPLQVTVLNSGIPLNGATVTFTAPSTGASATLSSPTATTNASGIASITATANLVAGSYSVTVSYQGVNATFALTNTTFAFITATGGTPQSAAVSAPFANPLQATVKDGLGNPVNGVTVTFTAPASGASAALSSPTAVTNAAGVATVTATANSISGSYAVTATVGTLTASFSLTNTPGAPASIAATGGTPQSIVISAPFPNALQATVKDGAGNPVSGVIVTFTAPSTGASATLSSPTATTNAAGVASVTVTANGTSGSYNVTANAGTLATIFPLTNTGIGSVTATGGTPQSALLGQAFAAALQVTVKDTAGNPASGIIVTFTPPQSGASAVLSSLSATTNAAGVASVTAAANNILGSYAVTASVGTLLTSFSLNNTSGPAATLTATGGTLQSALLGASFPNALQVTVKDGNGLPVVGVTVTFTVPISGASAVLSSPSAVTNVFGVASVTATASNLAGSYSVTATLGSLTTFFSLTNLLGGGSDLALGKSATQSSTLPGTSGAAAAVDGNTDGQFFDGSVTATNQDNNAWWQVDLGGTAAISSVVIWNRTDCCASRLGDYWVFVSNTPFLATDTPTTLQNRAGTFSSHQTVAPNPSTTIAVNGAQGQYVRVQLTGMDYLSLAEVQVMGTGGAPAPTNLAQGKSATQSSTIAGVASAAASSAVDGNTDGQFFDGSVTATNADTNAWWQVDLGVSSTISSVTIWNRTDCCSSRLGDYWIFISDTPFLATDTPTTLQSRASTFSSHQTTAPNPSATIQAVTQGRYVRVQLTGATNLSLAEVQVFGVAPLVTNLASGKVATQSSTYPGSAQGAAAAVDGNTDGIYNDGSVTATNPDANAWWQVDLGASATVNSVVVWNRTDCCGGRLGDYWVFVSNTPFLASDTPTTLQGRAGTFSSHQTTAPSPFTTIAFNSVQGRYVRVQLTGTDYLSLAEVQVYGTGGAPAPTNLALGKAAAQSSTIQGYATAGAGSAVDGNLDGNFFDGSVTATNLDPNAWWQVDLGATATVGSVVIFNRTDCCSSRLGDYWVFVSNTPFLASDTPTTLQGRAGTFASHQTTAPNPSTTIPVAMQGRYVRVQLSSPNYLSLTEVQVFGQ
jgi:hypothetical protein